ncbi:MAG: pentapeptide repeat-containing protein [Desulfomonile sp.]|nr:pentapeptide repeat-containing protein [Desulfomonile sp.]
MPYPSLPPPPTKRVVQARDALECLKAGLHDSLIMKRFNISAKGLQSLMAQLEEAGLVTPSILAQRAAATQEPIEVNESITGGNNRRAAAHREMLGRVPESTSPIAADSTPSVGADQTLFEIRHVLTGEIIFAGEAPSLGDLVRKAVAVNADLSNAELSHAGLARLDLSGARLASANLTKANLPGADLTGANLNAAILASADLFGAILYKTNFAAADLSGANLGMAYAVWAFFSGANLAECDLSRADLSGANLTGANLFEAIVTAANLKGACLPATKLEFTRGTPLE